MVSFCGKIYKTKRILKNKMVTIEVDVKGNVHFPEEFGIKPKEKIIVIQIDDAVVIRKPKKETADKIKGMTKKVFKEVDWKEIEKEREDREWL